MDYCSASILPARHRRIPRRTNVFEPNPPTLSIFPTLPALPASCPNLPTYSHSPQLTHLRQTPILSKVSEALRLSSMPVLPIARPSPSLWIHAIMTIRRTFCYLLALETSAPSAVHCIALGWSRIKTRSAPIKTQGDRWQPREQFQANLSAGVDSARPRGKLHGMRDVQTCILFPSSPNHKTVP